MAEQNQTPKRRRTVWPWSRRTKIWDPPTLLDRVLDSPLRLLVNILYTVLIALRGAPLKPPRNRPAIRIVCISDTHTNQLTNIPPGDVLIHAGDLTNAGTVEEIQAHLDWLDALPHKEKIVIAGNHDSYFDPRSRTAEDKGKKLQLKGLHYLCNQSVTLEFKGGRRLTFYGSPDIPECGPSSYAFQYKPDASPWHNRIPMETDVLITHTPPRSHLDMDLGCPGLLQELWRVRPRLHVFGHVHSGHGQQPVFWDKGQLAYERLMASKKGNLLWDLAPSRAWLESFRVLLYGVRAILWDRLMVGPNGGDGGWMVNAAIVWQSTTEVGHSPQVVEL